MPSRATFEAATSAAEAAIDFAGPLIEQACAERAALLRFGKGEAAAKTGSAEGQSLATGDSANVGGTSGSPARSEEAASASDLSLAAYLGFALSALELAAETSTCTAGAAGDGGAAITASAAAAPGTPPGPPGLKDDQAAAGARAALARAEERLVGLVVGGPAAPFLDLRFLLLHGCRLSHADRAERRRTRTRTRTRESGKKDGGQERGRGRGAGSSTGGGSGGPVGLGEAAVGGALPWTLAGVSSLAYLVSRGLGAGPGRTVVASAFCGGCGERGVFSPAGQVCRVVAMLPALYFFLWRKRGAGRPNLWRNSRPRTGPCAGKGASPTATAFTPFPSPPAVFSRQCARQGILCDLLLFLFLVVANTCAIVVEATEKKSQWMPDEALLPRPRPHFISVPARWPVRLSFARNGFLWCGPGRRDAGCFCHTRR